LGCKALWSDQLLSLLTQPFAYLKAGILRLYPADAVSVAGYYFLRHQRTRRDFVSEAASYSQFFVSCLMVTLPSPIRLAFVKRAIAAYCAQTHLPRELVIVLDQGPAEAKAAIAACVAALGRSDIRIVEPSGTLTLGALRNFSRASARGQVHCQWDDDDLHHPQRVERQLATLAGSGAQAVCLQDVMQFFTTTRALYWTNWRAAEPTVMPATLMCWATAPVSYPESGPKAMLGEDSDVCMQFLRLGVLRPLADAPNLMVYVNHGVNTRSNDFHAMLAERLGVSQGLLRRREAKIREWLQAFDFGAGVVSVQGPNGVAFTLGCGV
jgi:glycosyltransferase involved in cell wall biosynthesis